MNNVDIAALIRSPSPEKRELGRELCTIEQATNDQVNLRIDTPAERKAAYQQLNGDRLQLFEDLLVAEPVAPKPQKLQVKRFKGPVFSRWFAVGLAQVEAATAGHQKSAQLARSGNYVVRSLVKAVGSSGDAFTYEVQYRPRQPDDPRQIFGPVRSRSVFNGLAHSEASKDMHEKEAELSAQGYSIDRSRVVEISNGLGRFSYEITYS